MALTKGGCQDEFNQRDSLRRWLVKQKFHEDPDDPD